MTAPNGSIVFNNSTGSDTQASGLGPANAVYGTGASTTGASAVVTGIDTTGVTAGDLLWVESSSGRQFSIIASVDSSTQVTCDDNFDNTEGSRTWAIGGKRQTLDNVSSRRIFYDDLPVYTTVDEYFEINVQNTGTPYYLTSSLYVGLGGRKTVKFYGDTGNVELSWNTNSQGFAIRRMIIIKNFKLSNTNASKTSSAIAVYKSAASSNCSLDNVVLDKTNNWYTGIAGALAAGDLIAANCSFSYCIGNGAENYGTDKFYNCKFNNNGLNGIYRGAPGHYINCQFSNNGSYGYSHTGNPAYGPAFNSCIFYNNSSGGIYDRSTYAPNNTSMANCIFHSNGGYAVDRDIDDAEQVLTIYVNNAFYNSSTSNYRSYDRGGVTLTADPFVNAANGDFNINTSNGGGAVLRSTSYDLV